MLNELPSNVTGEIEAVFDPNRDLLNGEKIDLGFGIIGLMTKFNNGDREITVVDVRHTTLDLIDGIRYAKTLKNIIANQMWDSYFPNGGAFEIQQNKKSMTIYLREPINSNK